MVLITYISMLKKMTVDFDQIILCCKGLITSNSKIPNKNFPPKSLKTSENFLKIP